MKRWRIDGSARRSIATGLAIAVAEPNVSRGRIETELKTLINQALDK